MGLGLWTCAQFGNQYKLNPSTTETIYFTWAQGFMSGWNGAQMAEKHQYVNLSVMSTEAQEEHIRSYCDQHPLNEYASAVIDLLHLLATLQTTPNSK